MLKSQHSTRLPTDSAAQKWSIPNHAKRAPHSARIACYFSCYARCGEFRSWLSSEGDMVRCASSPAPPLEYRPATKPLADHAAIAWSPAATLASNAGNMDDLPDKGGNQHGQTATQDHAQGGSG